MPKSFHILMRSPADVTVLEGPSWWTPAHDLIVLGLAFAATLFVLGWVVILRRRIQLQAESSARASRDSVISRTTIPSRASAPALVLEDRLEYALERARRDQDGFALLMLDLDKFKDVNDTFGHQAGDEVLIVTAQRLLEVVRASDTVVRLGGDEFVVLLSKIRDTRAAELVASVVVSSLSLPVSYAGMEIPVSVSVGIGTAFSGEVNTETLLRHADAALYQAKKNGGHGYQAFFDGMEVILRAKKWEQDDEEAVASRVR